MHNSENTILPNFFTFSELLQAKHSPLSSGFHIMAAGGGSVGVEELACIYSAAILVDDDVPITRDKIASLLKAAGVSVEPFWPSLYAKALRSVDVKKLITDLSQVKVNRGDNADVKAEADRGNITTSDVISKGHNSVDVGDEFEDEDNVNMFDLFGAD